jgi:hypothetical protein
MKSSWFKVGVGGPTLAHFTRASKKASAFDNLVSILREGVLRASGRMVRGQRPVICFFDASLEELARALTRRNRRRYEPFGVAVDRRYAFRNGARPVIYLPADEARGLLPREELWRAVALQLDRDPPVDWSFEREWRLAGDLPLHNKHVVALVETWHDSEAIYDQFNGNPPCAGVIPLRDMFAYA